MGAIDLENLTKEQLAKELRAFVSEAEDMLDAVGKHGGEKLDEAKERFEHRIKLAKHELEKAETEILSRAKDAVKATDRYVHDNPWMTAGIAGGIGFLIGILISKR